MSGGSLPSTSRPLLTSDLALRERDRAVAGVEHDGDRPAAEGEHGLGAVEDLDLARRRGGEGTAYLQRLAVELQRRPARAGLRLDREVLPGSRASAATAARARPNRTAPGCPSTGSARGSGRATRRRCGTRRGPAAAPGARRRSRGRAPRPGRGTTTRAARASPASRRGPVRRRPVRRRTGWRAAPRRGWTAPRSGWRPPGRAWRKYDGCSRPCRRRSTWPAARRS